MQNGIEYKLEALDLIDDFQVSISRNRCKEKIEEPPNEKFR